MDTNIQWENFCDVEINHTNSQQNNNSTYGFQSGKDEVSHHRSVFVSRKEAYKALYAIYHLIKADLSRPVVTLPALYAERRSDKYLHRLPAMHRIDFWLCLWIPECQEA